MAGMQVPQGTPTKSVATSVEPSTASAATVAGPATTVGEGAVEAPASTTDLSLFLAGWDQARGQPAYLNSRHWQDATAPWAQSSSAATDGAFAAWIAMDLAFADAQRSRKTGSWSEMGGGDDLSALSGLRVGYLGSRLAFREDAFSLLAGSGQSLTVFSGLGQGAQKIA